MLLPLLYEALQFGGGQGGGGGSCNLEIGPGIPFLVRAQTPEQG